MITQESPSISVRSLSRESDKGCAIIVGSMLEEVLRKLHEARITLNIMAVPVALRGKFLKSLVAPYAPLSTLNGLIQLACAYGLVSTEEYQTLESIRKLRNEAAHSVREFS